MIETVKQQYTYLSLTAGAAVAGVPFSLNLGEKDVALLHALYYFWYGTAAAGHNAVAFGLWRKTDANPADAVIASMADDMLFSTFQRFNFVTESVWESKSEMIEFPKPIVLIRSPRLIGNMTTMSGVLGMRLYFTLKRLSEGEIAKLMVKDHA